MRTGSERDDGHSRTTSSAVSSGDHSRSASAPNRVGSPPGGAGHARAPRGRRPAPTPARARRRRARRLRRWSTCAAPPRARLPDPRRRGGRWRRCGRRRWAAAAARAGPRAAARPGRRAWRRPRPGRAGRRWPSRARTAAPRPIVTARHGSRVGRGEREQPHPRPHPLLRARAGSTRRAASTLPCSPPTVPTTRLPSGSATSTSRSRCLADQVRLSRRDERLHVVEHPGEHGLAQRPGRQLAAAPLGLPAAVQRRARPAGRAAAGRRPPTAASPSSSTGSASAPVVLAGEQRQPDPLAQELLHRVLDERDQVVERDDPVRRRAGAAARRGTARVPPSARRRRPRPASSARSKLNGPAASAPVRSCAGRTAAAGAAPRPARGASGPAVAATASSSSPSGTAGRPPGAGALVGAGVHHDEVLGGRADRVEQQLAVLAARVALADERVAGEQVVAVGHARAGEHAVVEPEQADHAVRHRPHRHQRGDGEGAGAEVGPGRAAAQPVGEQRRGRRPARAATVAACGPAARTAAASSARACAPCHASAPVVGGERVEARPSSAATQPLERLLARTARRARPRAGRRTRRAARAGRRRRTRRRPAAARCPASCVLAVARTSPPPSSSRSSPADQVFCGEAVEPERRPVRARRGPTAPRSGRPARAAARGRRRRAGSAPHRRGGRAGRAPATR